MEMKSMQSEVERCVTRGLNYLHGNIDENFNLPPEKILFLAYACFNRAAMIINEFLNQSDE